MHPTLSLIGVAGVLGALALPSASASPTQAAADCRRADGRCVEVLRIREFQNRARSNAGNAPWTPTDNDYRLYAEVNPSTGDLLAIQYVKNGGVGCSPGASRQGRGDGWNGPQYSYQRCPLNVVSHGCVINGEHDAVILRGRGDLSPRAGGGLALDYLYAFPDRRVDPSLTIAQDSGRWHMRYAGRPFVRLDTYAAYGHPNGWSFLDWRQIGIGRLVPAS